MSTKTYTPVNRAVWIGADTRCKAGETVEMTADEAKPFLEAKQLMLADAYDTPEEAVVVAETPDEAVEEEEPRRRRRAYVG